MAIFSGCNCVIAGTFKGLTHATITKFLSNNGATITTKATDPALTHLIASEVEYDKGKKAQAVLERRQANEPIYIVPLTWVQDSIDQGRKLDEEDYDFGTASADQGGQDEEEEDEEDDQKMAPTSKSKGKGKATPAAAPKGKGKRARSPSPTPPLAVATPALPAKVVKVEQKETVPVDHLCPVKSSVHVYIDPAGLPYDAMLNQTNLANNNNKYFIIQALQDDNNPNKCYAFFRWGRVGENGQQNLVPCAGATQAIQAFEKKFKDKTTHTFANRLNPPKAGKYTYLERSFEPDEEEDEAEDSQPIASTSAATKKKAKKESDQAEPVSALPESVQRLMQMIFSLSALNMTLSSFEYDARKLPLGKLAKSTMEQGYGALKDIAELLVDPTLAQSKHGCGLGTAFTQLSDRYYTLVPHTFGRNRPPVIDNKVKLKHELDLVDALGDLKITQELISSAKLNALDGLHPLDAQYQSLGLQKLDPIPPTSRVFTTLSALISHTKGATHNWDLTLVDAFSVQRTEDDLKFEAFSKKLVGGGNRALLWHGSRSSNYGGILKEGARIAPPEAPVSGVSFQDGGRRAPSERTGQADPYFPSHYMFGKGFYLASMSSKSSQYCYHQISNNEGLLMLVEAQLGPKPFHQCEQAEYEADVSSRKAGMLSTWGIGRTQPVAWQDASILDPALKGVQMPSISRDPIEANRTSSLLYDEFIVYNTSQVRIRYLLRVKFDDGSASYY